MPVRPGDAKHRADPLESVRSGVRPDLDVVYATRPGMGLTTVIDAHDVTPVPGYGAHGPFYRLYLIKPGYIVKIRWNGVPDGLPATAA